MFDEKNDCFNGLDNVEVGGFNKCCGFYEKYFYGGVFFFVIELY